MLPANTRFLSVAAATVLIGCCYVAVSGQSPDSQIFPVANEPNWVGNDTLVVVQIAGSNSFAAYSKHSGKWSTHSFPDGVVAIPVISGNCAAFQLTGEGISEVVAIDRNGEWRTRRLIQAANQCVPIVGNDVAAIQTGDHTYAFSATKGAWDIVMSSTAPRISNDTVMLLSPDRISAFSAKTAAWAESPSLKP